MLLLLLSVVVDVVVVLLLVVVCVLVRLHVCVFPPLNPGNIFCLLFV